MSHHPNPVRPGNTRLVISRRDGESFHIGDDITIDVRINSEHSAQIAIECPKDINILRDELKT